MRILNAVCFDISVHYGINGEPGYRFDSQFLGNVLPMTDHRGKADVQFLGNFLVDESFGYQFQYFDFTGGKIVRIYGFGLRMFTSMMSMLVHL